MAITIETFEDWGPATGSPLKGTNRTLTTNANLKSVSDPSQHYYLNDLTRPAPVVMSDDFVSFSYKRYLSFKISGTYSKIKNLKIEIPEAYAVGNWQVSYGMTSVYEQPSGGVTSLNRYTGTFDGSLIPLTSAVTLFPLISAAGPEQATTRLLTYGPNATLWTQYLVLQFTAFESTFTDIDNQGAENITVTLEELEI